MDVEKKGQKSQGPKKSQDPKSFKDPKKQVKGNNGKKGEKDGKVHQRSRLTLPERVELPADHPDKLYKGVFISKLRKKKGMAGRIKCQEFKCKIDVRFSNGALHESEVYWKELSRRQNKKQAPKEAPKDAPKDAPKYVERVQETSPKETNQEGEPKIELESTPVSELTQEIDKLKIQDTNNRGYEDEDQEEDLRKDNRNKDSGEIKADQNEEESESEGEEDEDDFTINAKIISIISCPHQHRNIVCTINLERNKYKPSTHKNHLIALEEDYFLDGSPTNPRIERFVIENLEPMKKQVSKVRKDALHFFDNHYFSLRYIEWRREDMYPFAEIASVVSQGFTPEGQSQALLQELNLVGYDESKSEIEIPLQVTPQHKDYRNLLVFSVDPATSVDLDDALSIEPCEEGFEIGIHIADVTSYSKFFDRQKLSKISSSAYLPYSAKHMLPIHLVKIITLGANVDRLAFSVFVVVNKKGEVQRARFQKTIIHSKAKLAYEHAQRVIDKVNPEFPEYVDANLAKQLSIRIIHLNKLAKIRRQQRTIIDLFNNSQIKFDLDQKNYPIDIKKYQRQDANKMIEEFMLLGNQLVASKLVEKMPQDAIIIHHPAPSKTNRDFFNKMFQDYGYILDFKTMRDLEENILGFMERGKENEAIHELIKMKASRLHELAMYTRITPDSKGHFALGMENYTHFTSPMRRFPDIIAAEQLMRCLKSQGEIILSEEERKALDSQILSANEKRRANKRLSSMILEKFLCLLIRKVDSCIETNAIIVSSGASSVTILIPDYDLQKEIYWRQELDISRVKSIGKQVEVSFYHQKKLVFWRVKKHAQLKVRIDSSKGLPLELVVHLLVEIDEKEYFIRAYR